MNILISPLGLAPGAVTALYHALQEQAGISIDKVITVSTNDPLVDQASKVVKRWLNRHGVDYEAQSTGTPELLEDRSVYRFARLVGRLIVQHRAAGHAVHVGVAAGRSSMAALASLSVWLNGANGLYHLWIDRDIEDRGDVRHFYELSVEWQQRVLHPPFEEGGKQLYALVKLPILNLQPVHEQLVSVVQHNLLPALRPEPEIVPIVQEIVATSDLRGFLNMLPDELTVDQLKEILELQQKMSQIQARLQQPDADRVKLVQESRQILAKLTITLARTAVEDELEVERLIVLVGQGAPTATIIEQTLMLKGVGTWWQKLTKALKDYKQEIESAEKTVGIVTKIVGLFVI